MTNRVLLVSSNSSGRGGGERYLVFLARGLRELGCDVHALLSDITYMDIWAEHLTEEKIKVHRLRLKGLAQRPLRFIQAIMDREQISRISEFCRSLAPHMILVNQQYDEDGLDYLMGALRADVAPVGGVMHMPMTNKKRNSVLGKIRGRILEVWYHRNPYKLIFVSKGSQKEFEAYYNYPKSTAVVISGTFHLEIISKKKGDIFINNSPVIGFVGQFVPQKNLKRLVQAWIESKKTGLDSNLLLVGDGPERAAIENILIESAPGESWHITGWTAEPEVFFREMDVFVLTSHFEGLPLSLVEAVGYGIPAIVAPFNGAADVTIRAPWVKVVSDNSVGQIAAGIIETLPKLHQLKQTASVGIDNFREYFSLKRMATEILDVLDMKNARMHIAVFFSNIGFYHVARIQAAFDACSKLGWKMTAVQLTDASLEHPWGDTSDAIKFPLETIVSSETGATYNNRLPQVTYKMIGRCLRNLRPDIVFLPGWFSQLSIKTLRWCSKRRVPAVVMSESKYDDDERIWWKERIKSFLYVRKFAGALVGGEIHAEYAASLGIPRQRVFTGYDVVDNIHFSRCADFVRKNGFKVTAMNSKIPERPFFIVIGRMIPRKNIMGLLEAYTLYTSKTPDSPWDLAICGDGEEKIALEKAVQRLELQNVIHFPGFLPYEEVGYWYGFAKAFIHPALKEQWGLVVNEACAAGLPILCSRTVGARYDLVRERVNGFLFDPENIEDMAGCMLKIHQLTPDEQRKMGDESRRIVEAFSPSTFASAFTSAVQAVM